VSNPYTYMGPGTRWSEKNPAAENLENIARENADYLYDALSAIMDPEDPNALGTWTNPYIFAGGLAYIWWDTGVSMFRGKAASLPTSMIDGNLFIMG
jgi:hypothetical protein